MIHTNYSNEDYNYYPKKQKSDNNKLILALIFFGVLNFFVVCWAFGLFDPLFGKKRGRNEDAVPRAVAERTDPYPDEVARIQLFKDVKDSVVNIDTIQIQQNMFNWNYVEKEQGTGSGFIWDTQGHVVTNFHVIQSSLNPNQALKLRVTLADRSSYEATLIGISPDHDLAVLSINAPKSKLKPIKIGSSHDLEVGQTVYAIGNPFGQSLSLTQGIISALDREIHSPSNAIINGVVQTDAALNPGNSGGPLLDKDSRLIGVNTAITSPSGGSVGIGYSIPVDTVNRIVPELIKNGKTLRPVLGIVLLKDQYKSRIGIKNGVVIHRVEPNGPAAHAGLKGLEIAPNNQLKIGDIILAINNKTIDNLSDYEKVIRQYRPGENVIVKILRNDEEKDIEITLGGV